ncbi:MAG: outer membrane lipoprotein-sorting protein [Deltaproteobacteria bacterium]|nr:outer membrane lipoprotein-sorting protein [Deltaproteobacteria bacterium]
MRESFRSILLFLFILGVGVILFSARPVPAGSPSARKDSSLSGKALAQRVYDRENGDDSLARATMELISKGGRKRVRQFTIYTKDDGPLQKTLIRFHSPADIEGTGFLSIEKEGGNTEQFLYLPALRRTRRVVSSQKARRFVNTDFTYEDMERRPVEDSDHQFGKAPESAKRYRGGKAFWNIWCSGWCTNQAGRIGDGKESSVTRKD